MDEDLYINGRSVNTLSNNEIKKVLSGKGAKKKRSSFLEKYNNSDDLHPQKRRSVLNPSKLTDFKNSDVDNSSKQQLSNHDINKTNAQELFIKITNKVDFSSVLRNTGLDGSLNFQLITEYAKYISLRVISNDLDSTLLQPPPMLLVFYKNHILDTRNYNDFLKLIGANLNTDPNRNMFDINFDDDEENNLLSKRYEHTLNIYKNLFGEINNKIWPENWEHVLEPRKSLVKKEIQYEESCIVLEDSDTEVSVKEKRNLEIICIDTEESEQEDEFVHFEKQNNEENYSNNNYNNINKNNKNNNSNNNDNENDIDNCNDNDNEKDINDKNDKINNDINNNKIDINYNNNNNIDNNHKEGDISNTINGNKSKKPIISKKKKQKKTTLFKGLNFLITGFDKDAEKISEFITLGSGKVYDNINTFFSISDKHIGNIPNKMILASESAKTIKCIRGIVEGVDCIKVDWIYDFSEPEKLKPFDNYILPFGKSVFTQNNIYPTEDFNIKELFSNFKIEILTQDRNGSFIDDWSPILRKCGAKVVKRMFAKSKTDVYLLDDRYTNTPFHKISSDTGVPIVSTKWVFQSIIHQKRLDYNIHPSFLILNNEQKYKK
ncbi:hypothetical protein DICPUDRAFT_83433 [Dictyostelium purpureum]|uniref:BRCT domain-containing protein n=1 Tax=Dictyostelium purpureum TaxID=5786 RepID=F0ZZI9_DICPU|nr:uncharacterized protein DICPUDRAFT_83433 [Dictyostelium purpureum]EGC30647.1 hypothetical protein DICPUDRAFT_83433 [Dictyostelium purpureum]|eukprot:XP_003292828.1 hypothetical protein DICPUDRAFT_83433 [Dictyostelium purpureum]